MKTHTRNQGSALILCFILSITAAVLLTGLVALSLQVSLAAEDANDRLVRVYAAESGLDRVKQLVVENTTDSYDWLDQKAGTGPVTFSEGGTSFTIGDNQVQIAIEDAGGGWYLVRSTATDAQGRQTILGMTTQPRSYFSDYARFVSDNNLSIGSNASYDGKVHSNGYVNAGGSNITFYDDVTAAGAIYSNSSTTFHKNATPYVDPIQLPEASELEALCQNPPPGSLQYDWDNADFIAKFQAATGKTPNSTLRLEVDFQRDKMTVVSKCKVGGTWCTMTEADQDVPDGNAIYNRGTQTTVSGNISRRTSIISPNKVYMENSVRYVDDSGGPLWELRNKSDGSLASFDSGTNTWATTSSWKDTSNFTYTMATDWDTRAPLDGEGDPIIPCLGVVSGSTIYLKGSNNNREVHAALYTSGDVVRPNTGTSYKRKNLLIKGSIITTGTNPLSGSFSYRCYAYDPNLKTNPPPGFPSQLNPVFTNWHVVNEIN